MNLFKTFDGIEFLYKIVDNKVSMSDKDGEPMAYDADGKPTRTEGKLVEFVQSKWFQVPYLVMTVVDKMADSAIEPSPKRKGKSGDV